jgi:D-galactarolactone cycloisomerase
MAIREVLLSGPSEHTRARVAVPDGPGLGIEVDRAALERFRVE